MKNVADLDREIARWDTDLTQAFNNMLELKRPLAIDCCLNPSPPFFSKG